MKAALFFALAAASLTPWLPSWAALGAGLGLTLVVGNPFVEAVKRWQPLVLQAAVVGLGAGLDARVVGRVGLQGFGSTLVGLTATLVATAVLARALGVPRVLSALVGVGTAICGGSAIAAVAPAIDASAEETSVALSVVFVLNALALLLFPPLGAWLALSPEQFGLWAALAIHDTSSVVGAAMSMGPEALAVATTVKLARALWIIPVTLALGLAAGRNGAGKRPTFIALFVIASLLTTFVPGLSEVGALVAVGAKRLFGLALFLVGASVSREVLGRLGGRPLALGVALWVIVGVSSALAIRAELLHTLRPLERKAQVAAAPSAMPIP